MDLSQLIQGTVNIILLTTANLFAVIGIFAAIWLGLIYAFTRFGVNLMWASIAVPVIAVTLYFVAARFLRTLLPMEDLPFGFESLVTLVFLPAMIAGASGTSADPLDLATGSYIGIIWTSIIYLAMTALTYFVGRSFPDQHSRLRSHS
jgi:hypothetical protein